MGSHIWRTFVEMLWAGLVVDFHVLKQHFIFLNILPSSFFRVCNKIIQNFFKIIIMIKHEWFHQAQCCIFRVISGSQNLTSFSIRTVRTFVWSKQEFRKVAIVDS